MVTTGSAIETDIQLGRTFGANSPVILAHVPDSSKLDFGHAV